LNYLCIDLNPASSLNAPLLMNQPDLALTSPSSTHLHQEELIGEILADYRLGWLSRHASLLGRKEVLTGKAKFGIFGDGKELPQLAMAN